MPTPHTNLTFLPVQQALKPSRRQQILVVAMLSILITSCGKSGDAAAPGAGAARPPAEVGVVTVSLVARPS